jgi:hypothetical protein
MRGCWVTWPAQIQPRPTVNDLRPHLDRVVATISQHRYVADARYRYNPHQGQLAFVLCIPHGLTEFLVQAEAFAALIWALPAGGFATKHCSPAGGRPTAWLQLAHWPSDFNW